MVAGMEKMPKNVVDARQVLEPLGVSSAQKARETLAKYDKGDEAIRNQIGTDRAIYMALQILSSSESTHNGFNPKAAERHRGKEKSARRGRSNH